MPILASEALLCEHKKSNNTMFSSVMIEPLDVWFQVQHSHFWIIWHLSTSVHTPRGFELDLDLFRINSTWLYKEPKVSVLQGHAKLVQKGDCWVWNQNARGSILTGGNILLLEFFFLKHLKITMFQNKPFGKLLKENLAYKFWSFINLNALNR